jgi:hypothetical protein
MRFGAYETAPQRVHTATGLGLVLSLVLLSCSSRTAFRSGRFSFGHEWVGGGGKSLSFTGVLGQSSGQESHTYRNRLGKTCLFSSDIGPHRPYWATRPRLRVSCPFYDNVQLIQSSPKLIQQSRQVLIDEVTSQVRTGTNLSGLKTYLALKVVSHGPAAHLWE